MTPREAVDVLWRLGPLAIVRRDGAAKLPAEAHEAQAALTRALDVLDAFVPPGVTVSERLPAWDDREELLFSYQDGRRR